MFDPHNLAGTPLGSIKVALVSRCFVAPSMRDGRSARTVASQAPVGEAGGSLSAGGRRRTSARWAAPIWSTMRRNRPPAVGLSNCSCSPTRSDHRVEDVGLEPWPAAVTGGVEETVLPAEPKARN
jgi:hypothetical protein